MKQKHFCGDWACSYIGKYYISEVDGYTALNSPPPHPPRPAGPPKKIGFSSFPCFPELLDV